MLLTGFIRNLYGVDFSSVVVESYPTPALLARQVR